MKYLLFVVPVVGVVLILIMSYVSAFNSANRMETNIKATYESSESVLANYGRAVAEVAQVPAMQRDDLTQVVTAALEGRYGEEGSQATFQWIQEQNPNVDPAVYVQIQRVIEAGRNDFALEQRKLVDQKRIYTENLGSLWTGTWMNVAGYPRIDLDEYQIITSERASEAFDTGLEEAITLRP